MFSHSGNCYLSSTSVQEAEIAASALSLAGKPIRFIAEIPQSAIIRLSCP